MDDRKKDLSRQVDSKKVRDKRIDEMRKSAKKDRDIRNYAIREEAKKLEKVLRVTNFLEENDDDPLIRMMENMDVDEKNVVVKALQKRDRKSFEILYGRAKDSNKREALALIDYGVHTFFKEVVQSENWEERDKFNALYGLLDMYKSSPTIDGLLDFVYASTKPDILEYRELLVYAAMVAYEVPEQATIAPHLLKYCVEAVIDGSMRPVILANALRAMSNIKGEATPDLDIALTKILMNAENEEAYTLENVLWCLTEWGSYEVILANFDKYMELIKTHENDSVKEAALWIVSECPSAMIEDSDVIILLTFLTFNTKCALLSSMRLLKNFVMDGRCINSAYIDRLVRIFAKNDVVYRIAALEVMLEMERKHYSVKQALIDADGYDEVEYRRGAKDELFSSLCTELWEIISV